MSEESRRAYLALTIVCLWLTVEALLVVVAAGLGRKWGLW